MSDKTTIEFNDDTNDFIIRNIEMSWSDLWRPDEKYERYSCTLNTSDKDVITPLVKRIQAEFSAAGKKVTAKDVVTSGIAAKSFVRLNPEDSKSGHKYSIVLRAKKHAPRVLDADFAPLRMEEGEAQTWLSMVNVVGSIFMVNNEQLYAYGGLRVVQIVQPGTSGGGMSDEDAAKMLGGTLKKRDIADFRYQGPQGGSLESPGRPRRLEGSPPADFDDDLDDIPF